MWRKGSRLRLLAEVDIEELERLNEAMLKLTRDHAAALLELEQMNLKLKQREAQLIQTTVTDALTGVGNRLRLQQALVVELSRDNRTGAGLCLVMADLDHFKRINDVYGHTAGDDVLATFGAFLRQQTRTTDVVTRYGGEEFLILMPGTKLEKAWIAAERIRVGLASLQIEPLQEAVTASFGVVMREHGEESDSLVTRVDQALYSAKVGGRNRVVCG